MAETTPVEEISIGTRKSKLALIQANHISSLLSSTHPKLSFPIRTVMVRGDADKDSPFLQFQSQVATEEGGKNKIKSSIRHR
jgi:hydroxymethylbilane synthase